MRRAHALLVCSCSSIALGCGASPPEPTPPPADLGPVCAALQLPEAERAVAIRELDVGVRVSLHAVSPEEVQRSVGLRELPGTAPILILEARYEVSGAPTADVFLTLRPEGAAGPMGELTPSLEDWSYWTGEIRRRPSGRYDAGPERLCFGSLQQTMRWASGEGGPGPISRCHPDGHSIPPTRAEIEAAAPMASQLVSEILPRRVCSTAGCQERRFFALGELGRAWRLRLLLRVEEPRPISAGASSRWCVMDVAETTIEVPASDTPWRDLEAAVTARRAEASPTVVWVPAVDPLE